jgi:exonuclease VII small subunit
MPVPLVAPATVPPPCPATPAASAASAGFEARLAFHSAPARPPAPSDQLAQAVRSLEASQARLDRVLQAARQGRTFTAGELLALQSDAYRFSQTLDVASKVVEHGVQSVKQAVGAQV